MTLSIKIDIENANLAIFKDMAWRYAWLFTLCKKNLSELILRQTSVKFLTSKLEIPQPK